MLSRKIKFLFYSDTNRGYIIKYFFRDNISIVFSFFGAASLFGSSLLMRVISDDTAFSIYARAVILASMAFTWVPLGFDSYCCRVAKVESGKLLLPSIVYLWLAVLIPFGSILLAFWGVLYVGISTGSFFWAVLLCFSIGCSLVVNCLAKLLGDIFIAQLFSSVWKISFLVAAVVFIFFQADYFVMVAMTSFGSVAFLISVLFCRKKDRLEIDYKTENTINYPLWCATLFSISIFTLLSQLDRLFISMHLSDTEFSEYFFWSSIYLSPMVIIASFIGTKRFSAYKRGDSGKGILFKDSCIVLMAGLISIIVSTILGIALVELFPDRITWPELIVLIILIFIALVKCLFVYWASVVQLHYDAKWSFRSGIGLLLFMIIMLLSMELIKVNYIMILFVVLGVWSLRLVQFGLFLRQNVS